MSASLIILYFSTKGVRETTSNLQKVYSARTSRLRILGCFGGSTVVDEILGLGPNHNNRPHDELEEYISRYPGVIVAYDGMSYA